MSTFLDLKENDKIYIVRNQGKRIITVDEFSSILDIDERMKVEDEFKDILIKTLSFGIIKKIIYPGKRRTGPYNYMKMNGHQPIGVGSSYGEVEDENLIQFEILDVEKDEVGIINVYSPKETQSNEICGVSYFTDLMEAKNYIFKLCEKQIVELQEKRDRITKKIIEIATLRNDLENVC